MKIFPPVREMTTAASVFCRTRPSSWTALWIKQPQNLRLASARTFARRKPSPGLLRGPVLVHTLNREEEGWCLDANGLATTPQQSEVSGLEDWPARQRATERKHGLPAAAEGHGTATTISDRREWRGARAWNRGELPRTSYYGEIGNSRPPNEPEHMGSAGGRGLP